MSIKSINIKKIISNLLWMCLAAATVFVLVSAVKVSDNNVCKDVRIDITGVSNNFFIDKKDVLEIIKRYNKNKVKGRPIAAFNLRALETALNKEVWIKRADLYFDNNHVLQVNIDEREPVARVFSINGNSFYVDSTSAVLPLSDKLSALVPVFTGFSGTVQKLTKRDSVLLKQVRNMGVALQKDSFLMAMTEQIDIDGANQFILIPKIGKQLILFGAGTQIPQKFSKLKLFYREVMVTAGWSKYSTIDLQYERQIVAKIRGKEDIKADSLRTLQLMELMATQAEQRSADSALLFIAGNDNAAPDINSIQQSVEREEPMGAALQEDAALPIPVPVSQEATPVVSTVVPAVTTIASPVVPAEKKPATIIRPTKTVTKKIAVQAKSTNAKKPEQKVKTVKLKPKIVMPPANEY